jgi:hypothetical protein
LLVQLVNLIKAQGLYLILFDSFQRFIRQRRASATLWLYKEAGRNVSSQS